MVLSGFGQRPVWRRGRWGKDCSHIADRCKRCICEADKATCVEVGACGASHSGGEHMRGWDGGFSGITDTIGDAASSIASCPIPFAIGIAVGYMIKKSGVFKKITL